MFTKVGAGVALIKYNPTAQPNRIATDRGYNLDVKGLVASDNLQWYTGSQRPLIATRGNI